MIKEFLISILCCLAIIGVLCGFMGFGKYITTNINRVIFKQSLPYNESMVQELSKLRLELITSNDIQTRKAIQDTVNHRYANYDIDNIEDSKLQQFLIDCRNLKY